MASGATPPQPPLTPLIRLERTTALSRIRDGFRACGAALLLCVVTSAQEPTGSIRGVVYDDDFDTPMGGAKVAVVGVELDVLSSDQGSYRLSGLPPGSYTVVASKEGYVRQVKSGVVVTAGQLSDLDIRMPGEFTDLEEFVVQDLLQLGGGEAELLQLRFESPALMDAISAELMSRAGVSDAAGAMRLIAGATVEDGKFPVVRGLPDRYVSSQVNGVRMPSADEDKRAVELDQFPAAVMENLQIKKTFTPDQQGDASGGAVNVLTKGIPEDSVFEFKAQYSINTNAAGRDDFLSYAGGGVNSWGLDDGGRDVQTENFGQSWDGAVGVSPTEAPIDFKLSFATGGKNELDNGLTLGGFASLFYERDSSHIDDGEDNAYWVDTPGGPLVPEKKQNQGPDDFKTALFDVIESSQSVQWGGLTILGAEVEDHAVDLTVLYTHTAEDVAILAEDTRGKEYFFPGHDPGDPFSPGSDPLDIDIAPYIRSQTLEYTERTTGTFQLAGDHILPFDDYGPFFDFREPELDWNLSSNFADQNQPDKRLFGTLWKPETYNQGFPSIGIDPFFTDPFYSPFKPAANFNLGNLQRIWKTIEEDSTQASINLKLPFEQWDGEEGYLKFGLFDDRVDRVFDQDTFSNFGDSGSSVPLGWEEPWSEIFPGEFHPVGPTETDVDYTGEIELFAWYGMLDLPLTRDLNLITGARFESTSIGIVNQPEDDALWYPEGALGPETLDEGEGDVDFRQNDVLPSIGLVYQATDELTLRASYSRTVARQTFKELTPILQQEFLGGPVFVGNPGLGMSSLDNYDLRLDYEPYAGGLFSVSLFQKDLEDAIEYVQREVSFTFTTPENYPEGRLKGVEFEVRQHLGEFKDDLEGLRLGGNATFFSSNVKLPEDEAQIFIEDLEVPITERDMTATPEHLYNLYLTYDLPTDTQFAVFYTVKGDTLVAGAGESNNNFVPDVYATEFGTLNMSLSQSFGDHWSVKLQAKNLTDPKIKEVYRSDYVPGGDVTKTSYTKGREFSIGVTFTP